MDTGHVSASIAGDARDYRAISHAGDGRVVSIRSLVALSDAEAIAQMDALAGEFATDLWDGLRFVEHFVRRDVPTGRRIGADGTIILG